MKKSLFLLATAALVLASCSNDVTLDENQAPVNPNAPKEIGFTVLNHAPKHATKRAPVHGNAMPDQNIYVAAYQAATETGTVGNYFDKTTFKKNYQGGAVMAVGDNVWGGDPARYYPLGAATLNFLAVTGHSGSEDIDYNSSLVDFDATNYASAVTVNYTKSPAGFSATSQIDIMYATGQAVITRTNNNLTFAGGGSTSTENVAMAFNHALALLNFQVKAASGSENKIQVNKITIDNAAYTGVLGIANSKYNATDATAKDQPVIAWTPDARIDHVAVPGLEDYLVSNTAAWYPDNTGTNWANIMIIPSDKGVSPSQRGFDSFTIHYTLKISGQADQSYTYTYWPSGTQGNGINVQEGKIYTYQITFNLHEIRVEPTVNDWSNAAGSPYDVEVP